MESNDGGKAGAIIVSIFATFLIAKALHVSDPLAAGLTIIVAAGVFWWAYR